jgi:two-component system capsular synthesis sensor histidine kinase RcsC
MDQCLDTGNSRPAVRGSTYGSCLTSVMLDGARVLVADDDPLLLATVTDALTHLGAKVTSAASGAELIEQMANEGPFDLVVTDISMPWMNGLQAMQAARTAGVGTSVIFMTALADERIPAQVRALGENALLLRKPFDLSQLGAAASELLARKRTTAGSRTPP